MYISVRKFYTREKGNRIKMAVREKGSLVLIIFILCGLVIGGLIGELTAGVSWLTWIWTTIWNSRASNIRFRSSKINIRINV